MAKPTPQQIAEKNIRKVGGVQRKDGKWDMSKAVKNEAAKGGGKSGK